ncbi:IS66 family transposase, partial [Vibrio aestuarianus]|nr:IS66 family transposase [Vibrio aestuarianus]
MNDLPDDVEQLKAMLLALQEANLAKDKLLQAQQEEMAELKTRVDLLLEQLNLSKSKRFSSQSEKVAKGTFNEAEQQNALNKPAHHK